MSSDPASTKLWPTSQIQHPRKPLPCMSRAYDSMGGGCSLHLRSPAKFVPPATCILPSQQALRLDFQADVAGGANSGGDGTEMAGFPTGPPHCTQVCPVSCGVFQLQQSPFWRLPAQGTILANFPTQAQLCHGALHPSGGRGGNCRVLLLEGRGCLCPSLRAALP